MDVDPHGLMEGAAGGLKNSPVRRAGEKIILLQK